MKNLARKKQSHATILALTFTGLLGVSPGAHAEVGTLIGTCTYDATQNPSLANDCITIQSIFEAVVFTTAQNKLFLSFEKNCDSTAEAPTKGVQVNPLEGAANELLGYESPSLQDVLQFEALTTGADGSSQGDATYTYAANPGSAPDKAYKLHCTGVKLPPKNLIIAKPVSR